ncbi:lipid-A-disaccharide synthase [Andreprevotia lacus DSM 23236]|jgi:lipid-A-disaccharide synthase|uniref:Lipid-A-disaccharide synthase n=1 Tax=Andreprevotia lacus DSM 23236 TaxID=1121001 RepID=A0A1W1XLF2_9NEIS|nr:lipid-A-disaccharide synthase [Andreprevotia lacus]SMC24783.1 lipid-A-disaccharide synthase [Andreprevotia lacus DSM 23236]
MTYRLFEPAGSGPRIVVIAGESSGDLLGAQLIDALKLRYPQARFAGIAGPKMQAAGATTVIEMDALAVRGYVEVLRHLPRLLRIRSRLKAAILAEKPDLVIGIDAPDFNFNIEAAAKAAGIPAVHYVGPSVWAWRPERLKKIGKAVSHVLLLFPFEQDIYRQAGIPATYVGHPLADMMPLVPKQDEVREVLDVPSGKTVFAMLPGSRQSELEMHATLFVQTAQKLYERFPNSVFLVPLITRETRLQFETEMWKQGAQELPFRLLFGHAHEAMQAADAILVASGTAALEAMLAKRPTVVTYRLSNTTYRMVKKKLRLPYVSLPNVLEGRFLVPELLQHDATVDNLVQALSNSITDQRFAARLAARFADHHEALRCGAAERAAEAVAGVLGGRWR